MTTDLDKAIAQAEAARRGSLNDLGNLLRDLVDTSDQVLEIEAGAGITDGADVIYRSSVEKVGGLIKTSIFIDMAGLSSATSDLDVIGISTGPAHLGRITAARNGTIIAGRMTCLEIPASLTDIDLYASPELNAFEDGIAADTGETALVTKGGAWAASTFNALTGLPGANDYLYLCNGAADTADPFTTGKFLIELWGYEA